MVLRKEHVPQNYLEKGGTLAAPSPLLRGPEGINNIVC